jgi:N-acetyl-anhydromuramyl-L-alanine amidase AmpD
MRPINLIVLHCSASPNGLPVTPATIDAWHQARGFHRDPAAAALFNSGLRSIGYHFVIGTLGQLWTGRSIAEVGAHVAGFNAASIGVCMIGTDKFTRAQWTTLRTLLAGSAAADDFYSPITSLYRIPLASPTRATTPQGVAVTGGICGHRDLSPDQNGNGVVEPFEWLKTCPGFDVSRYLANNLTPAPELIL